MNARTVLILLAVVLALLGLGAVLFLVRPSGPPPIVPDVQHEEHASTGAPGASSTTEALPSPGAPRETAEGVHIPIPDEDEAAASGSALSIQLRGRVVDSSGQGVRAAEFMVLQYEYRGAGQDSGQEKRLSVQGGGEDQVARSDAQGRFELALRVKTSAHGLAHTLTYRIHARGWADLDDSREGYSGETLDLGDLTLARGVELRGFVRNEDGQRIEAAEITVLHRKGASWEGRVLARTQSDGTFTVAAAPEGEVSVFARTAGDLHSESVRLVLDPARAPDPLELVLQRTHDPDAISGVVLDPEGKPIPFAEIQVRHQGDPGAGMLITTADASGNFRVQASDHVLYSLFAKDPGQRYAPCLREGINGGAHDVELKLERGTRFTLLVKESQSNSVQSPSSVESFAAILLREDDHSRAGQFKESRHAGGRMELVAFPGEFYVEVRATGFADARVGPLVAEKLSGEVALELARLPGISGSVRSKEGALPGARVAVLQALGGQSVELSIGGFRSLVAAEELASTSTDEQGRFSIALAHSDQIYLRAEMNGFASQIFGPLDFDARAGASKLVLELARGGVLEVHVRRQSGTALANRIVGISNGSGQPRSRRTDEQGVARFENLASGGWQVKLLEQEGALSGMTVRVRSDSGPRPITSDCEVEEGRTTRHEIVLADPALLTLQFKPDTGQGIVWRVGAQRLEGADGQESPPILARGPDASGAWTLELPESGRQRLFVETDGDPALGIPASSPLFEAWEVFDVPPGASTHAFELALGSLAGTLRAPLEKNERILLDASDGSGRGARSEVRATESGAFRFPFAPAARCTVRRAGAHAATREFDVRAGESNALGEL